MAPRGAAARVTLDDIAAVDVDIVVVSANTALDFEGGAARSLLAACGPALAEALSAAKSRGTPRVGDIVPTRAGAHPRLRRILWAVIRDYRPGAVDDDDAAAIESALKKVWRIVATAKRRVGVGIVPLGAIELGAVRSAELIARSLLAARLPASLAEVVIVTNRQDDLMPMKRAVTQIVHAPSRSPSASSSPSLPPPPSPSPPPAPPSPARSKRAVVGAAVVETFDRCSGVAPVGCAGVLFRVRRSDAATRFLVQVHGAGTIDDIAVDAVPVADTVALHDGQHVLTCVLHGDGRPFTFGAFLSGAGRPLRAGPGVRALLSPPPSGWRQPDFDDRDWLTLTPRLALPPGTTATGPVWLRWSFHSGPPGRP